MATAAPTTRRAVLQGLLAAGIVAATGVTAPNAADAQITEIKALRARLEPLERLFFDQQLYEMHDRQPNVIDGSLEGNPSDIFEEWKSGFAPDVIEYIQTSGKF